jgi:hypothetical protein
LADTNDLHRVMVFADNRCRFPGPDIGTARNAGGSRQLRRDHLDRSIPGAREAPLRIRIRPSRFAVPLQVYSHWNSATRRGCTLFIGFITFVGTGSIASCTPAWMILSGHLTGDEFDVYTLLRCHHVDDDALQGLVLEQYRMQPRDNRHIDPGRVGLCFHRAHRIDPFS